MNPELLLKKKLSANLIKSVGVDVQTETNSISKNTKFVKCSIIKSEIHVSTNILIFKSKTLVFKINLKVDKNLNSIVRRAEIDFYHLRNILVMSFGQCFIPPLKPSKQSTAFDKKSLNLKQRTFSRFLRGIVRSPDLATHPLVIEFLKIDHYNIDKKNGLKEFSKRLQQKEQQLVKISNKNYKLNTINKIFRVTDPSKTIDLSEEFDHPLIDDAKDKSQKFLDEDQFVHKMETCVQGIMNLIP